MLQRYDNAEARTVLSVRSLVKCASCGGFGNKPRMLSGLIGVGLEGGWHHGRCVVQRLDARRVLTMPEAERSKITLRDVQVLGRFGTVLMRRLVDASQATN